jgi:uncharacterized protein (DUF433 family)
MSDPKLYVRVDEHGVMRVANSRVMLDSVVAGFDQGHSPETIRQQYPSLNLEDVYGAIAYYLANVKEVNDYMKRQAAVWQQWRGKIAEQPAPVVERLRAIRQGQVPEAS